MFTVGLTGGIASGKSAVADQLASHGATIIDTDVIAREVVAPGEDGLEAVIAEFGESVRDSHGGLDRGALRHIVFRDSSRLERLETLLHPRIRQRTLTQLEQADGPYAVVVVPLLFETDFHTLVDRALVVDCEPEQQVQRILQRDGGSREDAQAIIASQLSRADRLAGADDIIDNSGTLADLDAAVADLHAQYVAQAADAGA